MWESQAPCGLQAQPPGSCAGGASLYWLKREKSMRQTSPSLGGSARPSGRASCARPFQGIAISTVQPRSRSELSFTVPSTCTAVRSPGRSHRQKPMRGPRGWFLKPTPRNGRTPSFPRSNSGMLA